MSKLDISTILTYITLAISGFVIYHLLKKILEVEEKGEYYIPASVTIKLIKKELPIIVRTWQGKSIITCQLCNQKIRKGERAVFFPIASFFANYKDYIAFHEGCFLWGLTKTFKGKIKLTEKGKLLATIYKL